MLLEIGFQEDFGYYAVALEVVLIHVFLFKIVKMKAKDQSKCVLRCRCPRFLAECHTVVARFWQVSIADNALMNAMCGRLAPPRFMALLGAYCWSEIPRFLRYL
ncbi:hypothetical protein EJ08DRAFT_429342 [Tothia fuscella]|uniref:Uncharacterized protein n=1 Tax=Tothia fuscella TaxID=1048955 RepID=A0A9P4P001_9PEZI|nr:hypothetical protein EJ08DRAFT_429342 [Tothia fuscella]